MEESLIEVRQERLNGRNFAEYNWKENNFTGRAITLCVSLTEKMQELYCSTLGLELWRTSLVKQSCSSCCEDCLSCHSYRGGTRGSPLANSLVRCSMLIELIYKMHSIVALPRHGIHHSKYDRVSRVDAVECWPCSG